MKNYNETLQANSCIFLSEHFYLTNLKKATHFIWDASKGKGWQKQCEAKTAEIKLTTRWLETQENWSTMDENYRVMLKGKQTVNKVTEEKIMEGTTTTETTETQDVSLEVSASVHVCWQWYTTFSWPVFVRVCVSSHGVILRSLPGSSGVKLANCPSGPEYTVEDS